MTVEVEEAKVAARSMKVVSLEVMLQAATMEAKARVVAPVRAAVASAKAGREAALREEMTWAAKEAGSATPLPARWVGQQAPAQPVRREATRAARLLEGRVQVVAGLVAAAAGARRAVAGRREV